ncbi:MAG: hypothetical protein AB7I35_12130 [Ramlibacter sp.]
MSGPVTYQRPTLTWIKRRARRLMHFYKIERRLAVFDAAMDYAAFVGPTGGR